MSHFGNLWKCCFILQTNLTNLENNKEQRMRYNPEFVCPRTFFCFSTQYWLKWPETGHYVHPTVDQQQIQFCFKETKWGSRVAHWYVICLRIWRSLVQTLIKTKIVPNYKLCSIFEIQNYFLCIFATDDQGLGLYVQYLEDTIVNCVTVYMWHMDQ